MKAAYIKSTGPPDNIVYGELPKPQPLDAQVLVKVEAVDVNPIDTYVRGGIVAMPLPMPYIIGCDLAGVVEAVGPKAKTCRPGDRVWGSNQGLLGRQGTFAEYAVVEEQWLYPTPEGVSSETAVALALVGITAHLGLVHDAKLTAGDIIFVNGGSGGVGSAVVQMSKAIGARVVTTAGSREKADLCHDLGADLATPYLGAAYSIRQMKLNDALRGNITHRIYIGGHMIYHYHPSLEKLGVDVREFIQDAARSAAQAHAPATKPSTAPARKE